MVMIRSSMLEELERSSNELFKTKRSIDENLILEVSVKERRLKKGRRGGLLKSQNT